jgi:hypothetical protein
MLRIRDLEGIGKQRSGREKAGEERLPLSDESLCGFWQRTAVFETVETSLDGKSGGMAPALHRGYTPPSKWMKLKTKRLAKEHIVSA